MGKKVLCGTILTLLIGWLSFASVVAIGASSKANAVEAVQKTDTQYIKESLCRIENHTIRIEQKMDQHLAEKRR